VRGAGFFLAIVCNNWSKKMTMAIARRLKQASLALFMLSSLTMLQGAYADGTTAGTTISNTATVNYSVGGATQTPVTSAAVTFTVDNIVDMTLIEASAAPTTATANDSNRTTTFTLENTGNKSQQFRLTASNQSTGTASPFTGGVADAQDVNNIRIYRDNGTTPNAYDTGDTQIGVGTGTITLAVDAPTRILVVADIPGGAANGQRANVELTAFATNDGTTAVTSTAGPNNLNGEDIVVDDGNGSAVDQYWIQSAVITVTKAATVIDDGLGTTGPNAKAIPGATVEYTISVTNGGAAVATNLTVTDTLAAETAYVPGTLELNGSAAGAVTGSDVSVPIPSLAIGATATVTFQVEIQ